MCVWLLPQVVLSGLTNTYASYITTWEEYQVQRYEGAFTLYGPHTLDAYIQTAVQMAEVGAQLEGEGIGRGKGGGMEGGAAAGKRGPKWMDGWMDG
jgi:hypothetical protein